jgi:DNA-binding MarR family transcriptional regulator
MTENLKVRFRKEKEGPESELVNHFLNYYKTVFKDENLSYCILTEVYAEIGIPDILIIAWDSNIKERWIPERNNLNRQDIKILHHIFSTGRRGVKLDKIGEKLGYKPIDISNSIRRLSDADTVVLEDNFVRIKDKENTFFVKKIISIEAKIKNWKQAVNQAEINENFASHSYVLMPHDSVNENMLSSVKGNIGVLAHTGDKAKFKRKAKKTKLPGSYFSWVLNEYIGRKEFALT